MSDVVGNVVIRVGADISPLTKEVSRTGSVLGQLESSAKRSTAQIIAFDAASRKTATAMQELIGRTTGLRESMSSAQASASAFTSALENERRSFESLRASMDPLYAASKRYEEVVRETDVAVKLGIATQAEANSIQSLAAQRYLGLSEAQKAVSSTAFLASGNAKMLSMQLSQVAQQTMASGNFVQALAIQLPDMALGFGAIASAAGVVAGIALPAIVSAFGATSSATDALGASVDKLKQDLSDLKEENTVYSVDGIQGLIDKYGELNAQILSMIEARRQFTIDQSVADAKKAVDDLKASFGSAIDQVNIFGKAGMTALRAMEDQTGLTGAEVHKLKDAFDELASARTVSQQVAAMAKIREILADSKQKTSEWYGKLLDTEDALRQINKQGGGIGGWISAAISGAEDMAAKFWEAAKAAAAVKASEAKAKEFSGYGVVGARGDPRQFTPGANNSFGGSVYGTGDAVSGGGGGSSGQSAQDDLARMQAEFATEYETIQAQYQAKLDQLEEFRKQKLLTETEYNELEARVEADHTAGLAAIDREQQSQRLADMGSFFGALSGIAQAGGKGMVKAAATFGAIQSTIDAWRAYTQVLADPSFAGRPWARYAAALNVLGSAMKGVSAIRAAGGIGGGGGSTAGVGGAASGGGGGGGGGGTYYTVQLTGGDMYGPDQIRGLISAINKEVESGAVIKGIRAA